MYDIKYLNKEKTTYIEVRRAEEEDGVLRCADIDIKTNVNAINATSCR